jgi:hypothetical protein
VVVAAGAFGSTAKLAMENWSGGFSLARGQGSSRLILLPPPITMAFRKTLRAALALPKASTGFGGRSSQGSHTITVFGATGMTGKKAIVFGRNTTKIKKK